MRTDHVIPGEHIPRSPAPGRGDRFHGGRRRSCRMDWATAQQASGGFVLEHDSAVALEEAGTHRGGGRRSAIRFSRRRPI